MIINHSSLAGVVKKKKDCYPVYSDCTTVKGVRLSMLLYYGKNAAIFCM